MVDCRGVTGCLFDPLSITVIHMFGQVDAIFGDPNEPVVLVIGEGPGANGGNVAVSIIREVLRTGAINLGELISSGFVSVCVGLCINGLCKAISYFIISVAYDSVDACGTGKAVEIIVAKRLTSGRIEFVGNGRNVSRRVYGVIKVLNVPCCHTG